MHFNKLSLLTRTVRLHIFIPFIFLFFFLNANFPNNFIQMGRVNGSAKSVNKNPSIFLILHLKRTEKRGKKLVTRIEK